MRDNNGTGTQQEVCKFLANLMEILEKQMQEPSGDLIRRKSVKNAIYKVCLYEGNKDIFVKILDEINKLPSVKQEPKTGHWDRRACKCSECGYQITFSEYTEHKYKHCPNCGARMESEDKE